MAAVYLSAWTATLLWWAGVWRLSDGRPWRGVWAAGAAALAVHEAVAMHLAHGWSHAAAYEHTARAGGVGWGVYVNYLMLAVWAADAAWVWGWPAGYARRPRWVGRAVHGFLGFVVFNATVVFGGWPARVVFGVLFAPLIVRVVSGDATGVPSPPAGRTANPSTPPPRR
jgi:hypothetical protein